MSFRITWKVQLKCTALAIILTVIHYSMLDGALYSFITSKYSTIPTQNPSIDFFLYIFLIMLLITIFHELMHGIAYKFFGCSVSFGFNGLFAYTKETSGKALERNKFLVVLLFPIFIISLLSLFFDGWIKAFVYLLNLLGSSGDIYMALYLIKTKPENKIVDKPYGFDVI